MCQICVDFAAFDAAMTAHIAKVLPAQIAKATMQTRYEGIAALYGNDTPNNTRE